MIGKAVSADTVSYTKHRTRQSVLQLAEALQVGIAYKARRQEIGRVLKYTKGVIKILQYRYLPQNDVLELSAYDFLWRP